MRVTGAAVTNKKQTKKLRIFHIELHTIQNLLDFGGGISPNPSQTEGYSGVFRLTFTRRDQLLCFITLLYGNCRFQSRHTTFKKWAALFLDHHVSMMKKTRGLSSNLTEKNKRWYQAFLLVSGIFCPDVPCRECRQLNLENAWFAGFFEAEGTFRSQLYIREKVKRGVSLALEFRQNDAFLEFHTFKQGFGGYLRREGKSFQLRVSSQRELQAFKHYLSVYPLRGRKHIAQSRWFRACRLREQNRSLPPKGTLEYRRFVRVFRCVNFVKN